MGAKLTVWFGFLLLIAAFVLSVHLEPRILYQGLVGSTPAPEWWPAEYAGLLRGIGALLIWVASSMAAIPTIVRAFWPEMNKIGWVAFLLFAGTHIFLYGLPVGWGWLIDFVAAMVCSGIAVALFTHRLRS